MVAKIKLIAKFAVEVYMHKMGHETAHETGYYAPHVDLHAVLDSVKCLWFVFGL